MGDLNSRLGVIINDHNQTINENGRNLKDLIYKYKLQIVNNVFCPGYKTYSKRINGKLSTSIIDVALSNNIQNNVSKFCINQNKIYKSHKPIIAQLINADVDIAQIDPIFALRLSPTKNGDLITRQKTHLQKQYKVLFDLVSKFFAVSTDKTLIRYIEIITYTSYFILFRHIINLMVYIVLIQSK